MARRVWPFVAFAAPLLLLAGCSDYGRQQRPAWRTQAENACLAQNLVHVSAFVQPENEIDGPGICGLTRPFKVTALLDGEVTFNAPYTLDCPMIAELNNWLHDVVQPEAEARFNSRVVELIGMGSYACRGINGQWGARLSEHAFGNAIDIGGFRLADGRIISIVHDWYHGNPASEAFLRNVHGGACSYFTTVLGPGYNIFHYNHIHVDLAMRGNTSTGLRRVCRPEPQMAPPAAPSDGLPEPPPLDEDLDISQAGAANAQALALHGPGGNLDAAIPPSAIASAYHAADRNSEKPMPGSAYQPYRPPGDVGGNGGGYGGYTPAQQHMTQSDNPSPAPEGRPQDWDWQGGR